MIIVIQRQYVFDLYFLASPGPWPIFLSVYEVLDLFLIFGTLDFLEFSFRAILLPSANRFLIAMQETLSLVRSVLVSNRFWLVVCLYTYSQNLLVYVVFSPSYQFYYLVLFTYGTNWYLWLYLRISFYAPKNFTFIRQNLIGPYSFLLGSS